MPNDPYEEIDRLRGELAAARWCIRVLFRLSLALADDDAKSLIRGKLSDLNVVTDNDFVREGFERFKEKLLQRFPDGPSAMTITGHDDSPDENSA